MPSTDRVELFKYSTKVLPFNFPFKVGIYLFYRKFLYSNALAGTVHLTGRALEAVEVGVRH